MIKNQIDLTTETRIIAASKNDALSAASEAELQEAVNVVRDSERMKNGVSNALAPLSALSDFKVPNEVREEILREFRREALTDISPPSGTRLHRRTRKHKTPNPKGENSMSKQTPNSNFIHALYIQDVFRNSGRYDLFPEFIDTLLNDEEIPRYIRRRVWALVSTAWTGQEAACVAVVAHFQDSENEIDLANRWKALTDELWKEFPPMPLKTEIDLMGIEPIVPLPF